MLRFGLGLMCGAVFVMFSAPASAQHRPAAWDTRVRSPSPSSAQDDNNTKEQQEQKEKSRKALDAAGGQKNKPKTN